MVQNLIWINCCRFAHSNVWGKKVLVMTLNLEMKKMATNEQLNYNHNCNNKKVPVRKAVCYSCHLKAACLSLLQLSPQSSLSQSVTAVTSMQSVTVLSPQCSLLQLSPQSSLSQPVTAVTSMQSVTVLSPQCSLLQLSPQSSLSQPVTAVTSMQSDTVLSPQSGLLQLQFCHLKAVHYSCHLKLRTEICW